MIRRGFICCVARLQGIGDSKLIHGLFDVNENECVKIDLKGK